MIGNIENGGYRAMYLPPYSPELNPIKQFWALAQGKMRRYRLKNEENLPQRIAALVIFMTFLDTLNVESSVAMIKQNSK